jgi:trigger factor
VKTDVEELSPTRVRLSVEVPFDELKPSLDKAYREIAKQVRIPGFRPGRVPPPVIDRRIGRDAVLTEAVNEAVPGLYDKAIAEADIQPLGTPEVEVTEIDDGKQLRLKFEVDTRPEFELPELEAVTVQVDGTLVTPDEVEEYLANLQERFASLKAVQRAVKDQDFVSIDLSAAVDGKAVEDAQASGLSYQVGTGSLLDGLDQALAGLSAGETGTFRTELAGGGFAGQEADVTVTVHSVKVKEMPSLDDDFAQLASEFDTLGEFRADTRIKLERSKSLQQVVQAREKAVEAVLDAVDIPLPESIVQSEIEHSKDSINDQLSQAGADLEGYLAAIGQTEDEFDLDVQQRARRSVKMSLVLDKLARQEELGVSTEELSEYIARQAAQMNVPAERLARQLQQNGQLAIPAAEVLRGKAMNIIVERVKVTDPSGAVVDIKAAMAAPAPGTEDHEGHDHPDDEAHDHPDDEAHDHSDAEGHDHPDNEGHDPTDDEGHDHPDDEP